MLDIGVMSKAKGHTPTQEFNDIYTTSCRADKLFYFCSLRGISRA